MLLISGSIFAEDLVDSQSFLPPDPTQANWVFSGMVSNENGDNYGYFFQMQREGEQFHTLAALFDAQTQQVVLLDESEALIHTHTPYSWQVGRAFMRFNPINESFIFGLKTKDKRGFNFKVDRLRSSSETMPVVQNMRSGVELLITQTSRLNGHVQVGVDQKEQFVTAQNAWFRLIGITAQKEKPHPFTGVLCRFMDGEGFYSVNMVEPDVIRGAVAGFRDEQGESVPMSQFVQVSEDANGSRHIRLTAPSFHVVLTPLMVQKSAVAGFFVAGKKSGFCALSKVIL